MQRHTPRLAIQATTSLRLTLFALATLVMTAHCAPATTRSGTTTTKEAPKLDAGAKAKVTTYELDTQETGYLPSVYLPHQEQEAVSSYGGGGYGGAGDAGKSAYAKQASDWSLYDQGAHGLYDKYGDKAWTDNGYGGHSSHGKHDSHSNVHNSHGSDQGSGYYSRDRGYGYERQYAFDRVVDSKSHSNNHQQYANSHGLQDYYGTKNNYNFNKGGHDKFGLANKYGHGYRQVGAHDDYAHSQSAAAHYPPPPPPLYKSNYYSSPQYPQMPSYY